MAGWPTPLCDTTGPRNSVFEEAGLTALTDPVHISIACHGGRGHTARLGEAVRAGASRAPDTKVTVIRVDRITVVICRRVDGE